MFTQTSDTLVIGGGGGLSRADVQPAAIWDGLVQFVYLDFRSITMRFAYLSRK